MDLLLGLTGQPGSEQGVVEGLYVGFHRQRVCPD